MRTEQLIFANNQFDKRPTLGDSAQWVLVFGSRKLIEDHMIFESIRSMYPKAYIMGCSSAGEIQENYVSDSQLNVTAIHLEKSTAIFGKIEIQKESDFFDLGSQLIDSLDKEDLKHVFLLTDGVNVNGSRLVEGMRAGTEGTISITGGLAGDGTDFIKTAVIANDYAKENIIVYVALYGGIQSGCASYGGFDTFGIERVVTKSKGNVLYEIDSQPVLDLYKEYLGDMAQQLPASALRFPLSFRYDNSEDSFVRTVVGIDESEKSLIFCADIPQNSHCMLMKSNVYNLINGAKIAAQLSQESLNTEKVDLAIVISCVGRKIILQQRTDEEVETIRDLIGDKATLTGYYSYGEIAPYQKDSICEMHNQTMTITFFSEE